MRERALALFDLGRHVDALEAAQRALIADPSDPESELLVARCHAALDDAHAAIHHAGRAGALDPSWPRPHMVRARVLVGIGHHEEAERAARTAIALAPDDPYTHANLAMVLALAERRPDDALRAAATAVDLDPDDADIRIAAAHVALTIGDWARAEQHAQAALAVRPDDDVALDLLGAALSHQRRPDDALRRFAGAARLDRTDPRDALDHNTARELAGTAGLDVRRIWLVLLAAMGVTWTLALLPRSLTVPAFIVTIVAAGAAWSSWRRTRRQRYEALSEHDRYLVDEARTDPSPMLVIMLRTVLGVAAFIGGLYVLQIVAPPADGATATPTQSAVVVSIALGVAGACWWRLRELRAPSEE